MIKLLIVDDSKINQIFARDTILSHHLPCKIDLCGNSIEALNHIYEYEYDMILLDIIMPHMTGVDMLQKLKENPPEHVPKIIMLSNIDNLDIIKTCFDLGASDYIRKPFEDVEFLSRIKSMLREIQSDNERIKNLKLIEQQNIALKEANNSLKEAQYYLLQKEKLVAIGELAAGIAHEINNPLAFVISNFETLKQYAKDLKPILEEVALCLQSPGLVAHKIDTIGQLWKTNEIDYIVSDLDEIFEDSEKGLHRVSKIVQSMRNFARISEEEVYEYTNVSEIIEETLLIVNNEIKYVAEVVKSIETGPLIYCNKGQIEQVLVNILVNAAHAIKAKQSETIGKIKIEAKQNEDYFEIHIFDNGIGIDTAYFNRIFEPFFTTKPVGQGTGLGLSISYDIVVNKHKGMLNVKSVKGEGSEFIVKLPIIIKEIGESNA